MAQKRMAELADMVGRQYHRFPAETWELTRKALETPQPHRLFQHMENLISTRRIDGILRKNAEFRGLLADMYGTRYEWLRDADLGGGRWEDSRESATETLAVRAKESEKDPTAVDKTKRDLMVEKIVEGGNDVGRWAKVLGFEGAVFSQAEIQLAATRMKTANANLITGDRAGYGVGEDREDIGGVDPTACPDGPKGTYGPSSHMGMAKQLTTASKEHKQPPPVPRAPAEGGKAPRNPFTTEWRARDAPDGWKFPATFDPYHNSNQYIRRSTRYKLPKIDQMDDDDGEEPDDEALGAEGDEYNYAGPSTAPTALAAMATTTRLQPAKATSRRTRPGQGSGIPIPRISRIPVRTQGATTTSAGTHENTRDTSASAQVIDLTGTSPPQVQQPLVPSISVNTRGRSQREGTTAVPTGPQITITMPTEHTRPPSQSPQETNMPTSSLGPPLEDGRIYTPPREQIPLSPLSPNLPGGASEDEDVDMFDVDPEEAGAEAEDEDAMIEETYGDNWLIEWLKRDSATSEKDLRMTDYQGWRIHSPKVQLIRIKNFLADEDIDRTIDWKRKFAEIGEYLQHCLRMEGAVGKDWYVDLRECMSMLHTHWVFEKHHYGDKKLVVDFPQSSGVSTRLPPLPDGRDIIAAKRPREPVRPRYLLHRVPESVQDVDYQIPGTLLRTMFMTWFRQDGNLVWAADPNGQPPGSGQRGKVFQYQPDFNMALTEDAWFAKCMDGGPETTSTALRGEANFYLLHNEYVAGEVGDIEVGGKRHAQQTFYPDGEAQQRFARYRGAKRAALQQCLSHFDGVENVAIQSPFRKLVLPLTRRQRERARAEAGVDIVYKPLAIKAPPKGAKLDPLGLVYWHAKLRENHAERADGLRAKVVASHRRLLEDTDTVLLPHNFLGPVTPFYFLTESERRLVARHTLLVGLRDKVRRAWARNPRQMLEGVVENMDRGLRGDASWNMRDELVAHREKHGRYLEMNDMELYWVDFACGPSTNVKMQREALPRLGRAFDVFTARVQTLLDEPSEECLFAVQKRNVSLQQVTLALNASLRQGDYVFSEDMVNKYSRVLADHGRLGYERAETGEVRISRPACTWHPENRMNWPVDDDDWDPTTNPWTAANVPSPDHTWDWETAFANVDKVDATRRATKRALWSAAYRAGVELGALAQKLAEVDRTLGKPAAWDYRANQLQDMTGDWRHEFERPDDKGARPASYASVVKEGYPGRWKRGMTEEQAVEVVRRGMIDELSAGDSTLWPSRPRFSRVGGRDVMTLHRERVWAWARPEVAGAKRRFFSVNRWPVHLQSERTQTEIRASLVNEKAERDREEEALAAEMAKVEARARPSREELQREQLARSLSVPYHEVNDPQTQFFPGHTEYWEGDTPLQKKVIKAHVQRVIEEVLGLNDGKAPRGTSWLGGGHAKASSSSSRDGDGAAAFGLPDVDPGVVPRSVPAGSISSTTGQMAAERGALDRPSRPTTPPRAIERRQPLLSPRYPPPRQETQRRVRFEEEKGKSDGSKE